MLVDVVEAVVVWCWSLLWRVGGGGNDCEVVVMWLRCGCGGDSVVC